MLDDSGHLTQVRSNADPPGGVAKGPGLEESPELYEEDFADECVKKLSVRISLEKDEGRRTRN